MYKLNKELGYGSGAHNYLTRKLNGEKSIQYDLLVRICDYLSNTTEETIKPEDYITEAVVVKL